MQKTFGLPFALWCSGLALVVLGALAVHARGRRNAQRSRSWPARVREVTHRSNASGLVQSVMATVVWTDDAGRQSSILTFPDSVVGGVWVGRELTMWQRMDLAAPPRLRRPGPSKRSLPIAGGAFAALVFLVAVHVTRVDENSKAVLKPFGIVLAAVCLVVASVNAVQLRTTRRILRGTPAAGPGRVIGLVRHVTTNQDNTTSTTYRPIVAFETAAGLHVLGLAGTATSLRKKWTGRTVEVRHAPGHPETFRLAKPSEAWAPTVNLLFALVLAAGGLVAAAYGSHPH